MTTHRLGVISLTIMTAAGLALAGCGGSSSSSGTGTTATAASPSPLAPKDALVASITSLSTTTFKFAGVLGNGSGLSATGAADPAKKSATITAQGTVQGISIKEEVIGIGSDYYVTVDLGPKYNKTLGVTAGQWMHIDPAKLGSSANLPFDLSSTDVLDLKGLLAGVGQVQRIDATQYSGVIDLTATTGVSAYSAEDLAKLGAKAKSVPFTATVDSQGRLIKFTIDTSAVNKDLTSTFTFSDFGTALSIAKPASFIEAPTAVYDMFKK